MPCEASAVNPSRVDGVSERLSCQEPTEAVLYHYFAGAESAASIYDRRGVAAGTYRLRDSDALDIVGGASKGVSWW